MAQILVRRDGAIAQVVISHPERRNAMTFEMLQQLARTFADLGDDDSVRVVLLMGEGGTFTAGADISQFEAIRADADGDKRFMAVLDAALAAPSRCARPVIGVLQDVCMGGGLELAAACDLRFAAKGTRFCMPAARTGAGYRIEGIRRFVDLIGPARSADLFFSARRFDADEALAIGFVDRVVEPSLLLEEAARYGQGIAGNAPLTVAAAKAAIRAVRADASAEDLAQAQARIAACIGSDDQKEGRRAFMEKRPPRFQGR